MPAKPKKATPDPVDEGATVGLDGDQPAEAAAAEALAANDVVIQFRDLEFTIDRGILRSARLLVAVASGQDHRILFEIIGPTEVDRFMSVLKRGEEMSTVASEFLGAVNKAAGSGNS